MLPPVAKLVARALIEYYHERPGTDRRAYLAASADVIAEVEKVERGSSAASLLQFNLADSLSYEGHAKLIDRLAKRMKVAIGSLTDDHFYSGLMPGRMPDESTEDFNKRFAAWEKQDEKMRKETDDPLGMLYEYGLRRTPLWGIGWEVLSKMRETILPYRFEYDPRFEGHLITGNSGTGKTTYLSRMIGNDLVDVAQGKCSVVVIDSQETLIPQLARSSLFAPGHPLEGKLIYIEPDEAHPLAINLLDHKGGRGALRMINFFMQSVSGQDKTPHMKTILDHVVPAVMSIEGATIFTLQQYMLKGYEAFKTQIRVPPEEHEWLRERLGKNNAEYKMTIGALNARLDSFSSDPYFKLMFRPTRSKLNLYEELQTPKVILINTSMNRLGDATSDFGRFWIAKLLQAVEERIGTPDDAKLPIFCYVDEAEQYIREERNIEELVDRARKQKLSLTVAIKEEAQITNAQVLNALRRMAIRTTLTKRGEAAVRVRSDEFTLINEKFAFGRPMGDKAWQDILNTIHYRYCYIPQVWTPEDDEGPQPETSRPEEFEDDIKPS